MGNMTSSDTLYVLRSEYPTRIVGLRSRLEAAEALQERLRQERTEDDLDILEIDLSVLDAEPSFLWRVRINQPFWRSATAGLQISLYRVAVYPDAAGELPYFQTDWDPDGELTMTLPHETQEEALKAAIGFWESHLKDEWAERKAAWDNDRGAEEGKRESYRSELESLRAELESLKAAQIVPAGETSV